MPSRWDSATRGWRRRVFHYPPPTLMSRNFRLPCAIELQPLSLTPLKMRKVELPVRPGTGELDAPIGAVLGEGVVDEHAVVVGVYPEDGKGQTSVATKL